MAAFTKINDFVQDLCNGVHNLNSDTLTLALSNTAPASETSNPVSDGNGVLANVTQVSYTNASTRVLSNSAVTISSGTATIDADTLVITASGGTVGPFRYVYLYNDTATNDELIGYWDYGSSITLADTETFTATISTNIATVA